MIITIICIIYEVSYESENDNRPQRYSGASGLDAVEFRTVNLPVKSQSLYPFCYHAPKIYVLGYDNTKRLKGLTRL